MQQRVESRQLQDAPDGPGRVGDDEPSLDSFELPRVEHQDADASRTDVVHLGHIHRDDVMAGPHALGQRVGHVVAPDGVHPALQPELKLFGAGCASDFHEQWGYGMVAPVICCACRSNASGTVKRAAWAFLRFTKICTLRGGENGIRAGLSPRMTRAALSAVSRPAS